MNFFKSRPELFGQSRVSFLDQERLTPLGNLSVKESLQILEEECHLDPATFRPGLVAGLTDRKVSELSGGENQLLKYVLATAPMFDALFVDEPLLNLDANNKSRFLELFAELVEKGKTLLIVEHEPERYGEVRGLTNKIIIKKERREVICGKL